MSKVRTALLTYYFGAPHVVARILCLGDVARRFRSDKARPAATGIVFIARVEQRGTATNAAVDSIFMAIPVFAAEGAFGVFSARDMVLLRS